MRKRAREISSPEESYASPVRQFPSSGVPSPPISSDGRSRRTRGSSSDDGPTVGDMVNEDYRAGGPYLAAMPCLTTPLSKDNPAPIIWEADRGFVRSILDVLRQHGVEAKNVELFGRRPEHIYDSGSEDVLETVVVTAERGRFDESWVSACFDIRNIFLQKGLKDLNIEIVDNRASAAKFATPVPPTHPIYPVWEDVCKRIIHKIGRKGWLALECFRWGESWEPDLNDGSMNPVTVILTIPRDHEQDWKQPREEIVSVLADFELHDVAVSIVRGTIWRGVGPQAEELPDSAWDPEAQLGMSIGPSNSDLSASTLGGFIELKALEGKWMRFGLTCFRSVIANKEEKDMGPKEMKWYENWKQNGIGAKDKHAGILKMDQPALKDNNRKMEELNKSIAWFLNDPELQQIQTDIEEDNFVMPRARKYFELEAKLQQRRVELRDTIKDFFPDKAYLGRALSASGFRRTNENPASQLDWALIKIDSERKGENKIPPKGEYVTQDYEFKGQELAGPFVGTIPEEHALFKIDRTTNFTKGKFTGLRSVLLPSGEVDDKGKPIENETWEHTATGFDRKVFSERGDSGAMIFDRRARFVGLLFGNNDCTRATYFTPWHRLVPDIKKVTGATDVRIPNDESG